MKRLSMVMTGIILLGFFAISCHAAPKALPINAVYTFEALPDGAYVSHDFVIKNTGDQPLNITRVIPP